MGRRNKKPVFDFKKAINLEYPAEYYIALWLGIFFLIISFNKLMNPPVFAEAVFHGHATKLSLVNGTALLLMSLEFTAAFAVVFMAKYRKAGLYILVGISLFYTGCITAGLLRDINTVSGWFVSSVRASAISWWTVARSLIPVAAGLFAVLRMK